jgi:LmbE family N-acetylglucosaminyl deacetylase
MTSLLISPHNDDESLFCAYTLMREKPLVLVVTDSYIQGKRGDGITMEQRRAETLAAMKIVGCPVVFGGIHDDEVTEESVSNLLKNFHGFDTVYAPAVQGGNAAHDIIGTVAKNIHNAVRYATYTKSELYTEGDIEVTPPSISAIQMKIDMLNCYKSQIMLPSTRPHFLAVAMKSEWLIK